MSTPLQLSISLPTFSADDPGTWQHVIDAAVAADEASIDRLVMSDHVVFGENLEAYADPSIGGQAGGKQPTGPDGHWLEPVTTIAHLTALTSRVRFSTNILLAALRRPVVLAKMLATIDVLSGGRLDIGVGVGWQREEYDAAGLSFERRGRLLDETIEVCQLLWREQAASHDGETLSFERIHLMPKPLQAGGVPVWVSGTVQDNAMRRLARFGSGWIPWGADAADAPTGITKMREAVARFDRDPADIGVVWNLRADKAEAAGELRDAGVTDLRIGGIALKGSRAEMLERLGEAVTAVRAAAG